MADVEADKIFLGLTLVILVKKQSEEILKLLVNFLMMRESSFIMDQIKNQVITGGK